MMLRRICGNDKREIITSLVCIVIIIFILVSLNEPTSNAQTASNPIRRSGAELRRNADRNWRLPKSTTPATTTRFMQVDAHMGDLTLHAYKPIAIRQQMTRDELDELFHAAVTTIHVTCRSSQRFGRKGDGGYDVCLASPYMDENLICLVYSFGVGDMWGFDMELANIKGCEVRAFDPYIGESAQRRGLQLWFFDQGISDHSGLASNGKQLLTFDNITKQFGHEARWIEILKIDIEQNEWEVLDGMMRDGSIARVKQLIVELHKDELRKATTSASRFIYFLGIIRRLEKFGFRRWRFALNVRGLVPPKLYDRTPRSCCYEQYYININYLSQSDFFEDVRKPDLMRLV